MDGGDPMIEAEVELDTETLLREQERRKDRRGEQAAAIAKGGIPAISSAEVDARNAADEGAPLLGRRGDDEEDGDDQGNSWQGNVDFAHLPWYKRPSIYWVIGPFFVMACAFGGSITPKLNLVLELICREYISERVAHDPTFWMGPVDFNNGENEQCRNNDDVQSRATQFMLWGGLIAGILAAFTSPKLGALSDRYGRKVVLIATSIGTIMSEIVTIFAAKYPETFPVPLYLLSFAFDGITGSFILAMSISSAYATDCTAPNHRNVAFGFFHASLFTGIAVGPILAGYVIKYTGKIVIVFYIMTAVHVAFVLFVASIVPESVSKKRQQLAREKHEAIVAAKDPNWDWINQLRAMNVLEPLKILLPTGPGTSAALRRNLLVLATVDTIAFGVAMGSMTVVIYYMERQFNWGNFEAGKFMTIVNSFRTFCLLAVLPGLTRLFRGKKDPAKQKNRGSDRLDLAIIRTSIAFDILGFLGYIFARQGSTFTLSAVIASIGGIGSPTLQSSLTKHVPAERTGQLLGAISLLHALARVIAPAVFNAIYAKTVKTYRQTVFVCLCATFGMAFLVSWFIRPHVYYDEDKAKQAEAEDEDTEQDANAEATPEVHYDQGRVPIASAVNAAVRSIGEQLGLAKKRDVLT